MDTYSIPMKQYQKIRESQNIRTRSCYADYYYYVTTITTAAAAAANLGLFVGPAVGFDFNPHTHLRPTEKVVGNPHRIPIPTEPVNSVSVCEIQTSAITFTQCLSVSTEFYIYSKIP